MSKKITINIAIASFFIMGAILIGIGVYLLAPSGEQSKLCYGNILDNPNAPSSDRCP